MKDNEGRSISYLRLSVTDKCNCRCIYCMPKDGIPMLCHEQILSYEELVRIVSATAQLGVTKVRLTGGEPLVRRNLVDLVRMIREIDGIQEIDLTTNATLLAPVAQDLKDAGLSRINVSLDTLDAEKYKKISRVGSLEDALAGLAAAKAAGFTGTKINSVLMGGINDDEIRDLCLLCKDEPYSLRFIELMPIGECATWPKERFISDEQVLKQVPELSLAAGQDGVSTLYTAEGWKGTVGLIRPMSNRFCKDCTRIRVTSDGKLKPCLHSSTEIPLRGLEGEELLEAIRQGILMKPAKHEMDETHISESARAMNEIGG